MDTQSLLSDRLEAMDGEVRALVDEHVRIWNAAAVEPAAADDRYTAAEKREVEKRLTGLVDDLSVERRRLAGAGPAPPGPAEMEEAIARLRPSFMDLVHRLRLRVEDVYDAGIVEATRGFLRAARDFDPGLSIASVYQALRNVWIMNTLQRYAGLEVRLTDAVFGYSMIYPYLDNLLDGREASETEKTAAVGKLRAWLEGRPALPSCIRQEKLRALVGRIEGQFPRDRFAAVFQSMLAIHNAQVRSLGQQEGGPAASSADILRISLEKGGASVLADGYLVAGDLTPRQRAFCFGFGTFLQLADDLQDVTEDLERGHVTLFSGRAGRSTLDELVGRLRGYTSAVLAAALGRDNPAEKALAGVIARSIVLMSLEAVGLQPRFFSRKFVRLSEHGFPVRFGYLGKLRRRLGSGFAAEEKTIADLDPLTTAFMAVSSRALSLG